MATAAFTEVVARVDQALTNAIWSDQLKDNLNQLAGAHRNLFTNGGFEVWQRGAGPFTADLAFTADRWQLDEGTASAGSVTQETTTIDVIGASSLACAYTHSATSLIFQTIENWKDLKGKTISISMRIRQSATSMVRLFVNEGLTVSTGSTTATTGSFTTHTLSVAIPTNATQCFVGVQLIASGTVYLDNAMLVVGPAPAPYQPLHPQEDLARCQRYYEVITTMNYLGSANGAHSMGQWVPWAVPKGGVPTVTKNGTWAVTNCAQPSTGSPAPAGFIILTNATGAGGVQFTANSADDTITGEWNP